MRRNKGLQIRSRRNSFLPDVEFESRVLSFHWNQDGMGFSVTKPFGYVLITLFLVLLIF